MGDTQDSTDTRSPLRISLVAFCRFGIAILILLTIVVVPVFLALRTYAYALDHSKEQWLAMVASVMTGGLIVQLGSRFLSSLLADIWALLTSLRMPNPATFRKRLYDFKTHVVPLFLIVFTALVLWKHAPAVDEIPDTKIVELINDEVTQAMTAQGYTRERAALLDRLDRRSWQADYYFARFPVAFGRAQFKQGGVMLRGTDISEYEFSDGVEYIADNNGDLVRRLVKALVPCGTSKSPVVLKVEGYASSEPFMNKTGDELIESKKLNVRVANERRRKVEEAIHAAINSTGAEDERRIVVVPGQDYNDLDEMKTARGFNDRSDEGDRGNGGFDQDFFTRAAHIKVLDLVKCAVD